MKRITNIATAWMIGLAVLSSQAFAKDNESWLNQGRITAVRSNLPVLIPSNFSPNTGAWDKSVAAVPSVGVMIANPSNGPGTRIDPNYQTSISQAQMNGIKIVGYVRTGFGRRSLSAVESEIDKYFAWYGVGGIFLDETATDSGHLNYYSVLYNYIHTKESFTTVVLNPKTYPEESYMSVSDIVVVFEDTLEAYANLKVPAWASNYPATRFSHMIYGASSITALNQAEQLAHQRNVGYAFVTDQATREPAGKLPGYWSTETAGSLGFQ